MEYVHSQEPPKTLLEVINRQVQYNAALMILAAYFYESARTDELTGLPNRKALQEAFENVCTSNIINIEDSRSDDERRHPNIGTHTIAIIDIDHFKDINDEHGHDVGDSVLQHVADIISKRPRGADLSSRLINEEETEVLVSRWGGEEFVLLLPNTDETGAVVVLEDIREQVKKETGTTMSAGIAKIDPRETLEKNVKRADAAVYQAKDWGRDQVVTESDLKGYAVNSTIAA